MEWVVSDNIILVSAQFTVCLVPKIFYVVGCPTFLVDYGVTFLASNKWVTGTYWLAAAGTGFRVGRKNI